MQRIGPATILSVLLHVGLFLLLFLSWTSAPKPLPVASIPVQLVSSVPMHEQAQAPVDKLAVKTPEPEPAPEEPVKPAPVPEPTPKLPVPTPQKEIVKTPPVKTPEPPKPTPPKPAPKPAPAPPDKNGAQKPQPPAPDKAKTPPAKPSKPALDLDALSQIAASPSKSKTRNPAQASTRATDGNSNFGSAPQDAGNSTDLKPVIEKVWPLWSPNCDVPGGNTAVPKIRFTISPNGRVIQGPEWVNQRNDPVWEAAAARAMQAVKRAELYTDLPQTLYNRPMAIDFDAQKACNR